MARSASAAALTSSRPQSAVTNPAPSPQPHHLGRSPRRAGWGWDAGAAASDEGVLGGAPTAALGALGAAIITEVEAAAATTRSELLLIDNERLRLDTEAMLREGRGDPGSQGSSPSHVQEAAEETYADEEGGLAEAAAASSEDGELDSQGAAERDAARAARKRQQRQLKARRILREMVRLSHGNASSASVSTWSLSGLDLAKVARVAVQISKTAEALKASEFFADLGDRQLSMMASAGVRRQLSRYAVLYREGALATCFYVLVGGTLLEQSLQPHWKEPELRPGERRPPGYSRHKRTLHCEKRAGASFLLFGMEALVGRPRQSTITVLEDCAVLKFPASDLNIRRDGAEQIARKVFNAFLEAELAHTYCFRGMASRSIKSLVTFLEPEECPAGTPLYGAGNPGDKVYVLMHGAVTLLRGKVTVATLSVEQGQASNTEHGLPIFGERAMLDRQPRSLAAVATADCKLLVLPLEQWAACSISVPELKSRLRKLKDIRTTDLG